MELPKSSLCTGCGACVSACVTGALVLTRDTCGFLHPVVNSSLCSDCQRCEKVCPLCTFAETTGVFKLYAAKAADKAIVEASSSGGAFSVLSEYVLQNGGVVFGAGFDEDFNVCHIKIDKKEDLKLIRGSKYVQSQFLLAAQKAADELKNGKIVLFSGTPCQIAALKNITDNINTGALYTVDFICHGVSSPLLFEKYRDFISKGRKFKSISFRDKTEGWHVYSLKAEFTDGTSYRKNITEDPYLLSFVTNISLRSSCNNCAFTGLKRVSDITLGDAWNDSPSKKELCDGRGLSLVLINTEKGNFLYSNVKDKLISEALSLEVLKRNKPLNVPTKVNPLKDRFYKDMYRLEFDRLISKYCGLSLAAKIRRVSANKLYRWKKH